MPANPSSVRNALWRASLPRGLDQASTTAARAEYVVKLYFRQLPTEAELTGWATLTTAV